MDDTHPDGPCYLGKRTQLWLKHVDDLNDLHASVLPKVLEKTLAGGWKRVHPDFPEMNGLDIQELAPGFDAMNFIIEETDAKFDLSKANRDEKNAMDVCKSAGHFMEIMMHRIKVRDFYEKINPESTEMQTKEYNNSVLVKKIEYLKARDDEAKQVQLCNEIMERFNAYEEAKTKMKNALVLFRESSRELAKVEGFVFNEKFNKNQYLNYYQFIKLNDWNNKKLKVYWEEQDECWNDVLKALDISNSESKRDTQPPSDLNSSRESSEETRKREKQKRYDHKFQVLNKSCKEVHSEISMATLEEHQGNLRELQDMLRELKELSYDPEIKVSDKWDESLKNTKILTRLLSEKIGKMQDEKIRESEARKQEVTANIRSLEAVKLLHLTGPEDFIAWKKNQKFLNSHTDPYKKAAALLGTLKNPQDKKMCETIYDFDKLICILNDKYNHQEKLVPALKGKLEKLPVAETDSAMLDNMRTILNVYEQLKEMGAKECFDGTVVFNMIKKLPRAKKDFERYKLMRKEIENLRANVNQTFDEDGFDVSHLNLTGSKDQLDLDLVDNSPEHRKLFLQFIRQEAKVLDYTKDESKPKDNKEKCGKCKQIIKYCKCSKPSRVQAFNVETSKECVCCHSKEPHLTKADKPTKSLGRCPKFRDMTLTEKRDFANRVKACYVCLVPGHSKKECTIKTNCKRCDKDRHHPALCKEDARPSGSSEEKVVEVNATRSKPYANEDEETHFQVTKTKVMFSDHKTRNKAGQKKYIEANILWDSASEVNMITKEFARKTGYRGPVKTITVEGISGEVTTSAEEVTIEIMDNKGEIHRIPSLAARYMKYKGITKNGCSKIRKRHRNKYAKMFGIPVSQICNEEGPIDMIIGIAQGSLHPEKIKWRKDDNVCAYKTDFGTKKYLLAGRFKVEADDEISSEKTVSVNTLEVKTKDFWTGDQLGLNTDPKCSTCLKAPPCKQCKLLNQPQSFKEQEEAKVIRASMNFDLDNKHISVSYPYTKDIDKVFTPELSNRFIAEKMAKNLKKSLQKDGLLETYTESFLDMEARGAIKELTPEEMEKWENEGNPINYCSHHAVLKDSKSTACRSVCNSSLTHNNTSLNSMLPKGPTAISNLLHVLMRFRARPYVIIADLKKAYNSITTSLKDCHLRRLLWYRKEDLNDPNADLRTFGMLVMAFGDTPAGFYLECAKEEVANYIRVVMEDHALADAIISMSYVDDLAISVETIKEAEVFVKKLPIGFGSYGFKIKEIFIGGHEVDQTSALENQLLFGHYYNPNDDKIMLKFAVNFSSKKRSQKTQPNLTSASDLSNLKLTKRKVMSLLSSQYDPLGLASVFLAKYKIFLAKIFKVPEYDWDVNLQGEHDKKGLDLVKQMIHAAENPPVFNRSNKPEGYKLGKLIIFVDGSTLALQVVVYGLYTNMGAVHTSLISGKNKIVQNSVPRNELQAMVAGHRLTLNVLEALDEPVPEVCFLGDSTCTLDSIKESFVTKDLYVINRISEIRKAALRMNCEVKYYHVESHLNIADKGTREDCKIDFLSSKEWQNGPDFIKDLDNSEATFKLRINGSQEDHVAACEINTISLSQDDAAEEDEWQSLLGRSKCLVTVLRTVCLVRSATQRKSFKAKTTQTVEEMNAAFLFLVKHTQKSLKLEAMRTKQLVTFEEEGIIYTQMRFPEHVRTAVFGKDKLPVIPGKSSLAKLLLSHAHQEAVAPNMNKVHVGIHQTLVNSRVGMYGAYITYAKQVIKGIVRSCPVCRRQTKQISDAKMSERQGGFGEVPPDGSCFNKIAMDYFGPFWCKPPKFKETRGTKFYKIYGMAVLCQQTRAVKFYPVEGYDTKSFLTTFEIHCSTHGVPTHVLSDPMTTFISGAKVVGGEAPNINEDAESSDFEATLQRKFNISWKFIPPGSQWRDPAERSIKSLKEMMQTIFNTEHNKTVLTINEYWSIFTQCSEILNRRPIQGYMHEDTLKFICPNQLLLGRTSKDPPAYTDEDLEARPRLELLQNIKSEFWKNLMNVLAADSRLMKYPCWYSQSREPKPGDVVLVLYKTKVNDNFRVGVIKSVNENKRDISCKVSPCQDGSLKNFKQTAMMDIPIQRTVLLYSPDEDC